MAGYLPRRQEIGRLKDRKEGLQGKNTGDRGMSSKREDSWHRKVFGTSPERRCCRTEVHCIKKKETLCEIVQGHA